MAFTVQLVSPSDTRRMAEIDVSAFDGDALRDSLLTFRTATSEQQQQHLEWQARQLRTQLEKDGDSTLYKITDYATGTIAGWADLKRPGFKVPPVSSASEAASNPAQEVDPVDQDLSPCLNLVAAGEYMSMWFGALLRHMGTRNDYFCVAKFCVDPAFDPSASDVLMRYLLGKADESAHETYFGAPPELVQLALAHNFRIAERIPYLDEDWNMTVMIRDGSS